MKKANVLIVEDESLIAEELKRIIQRLGHQVIGIANRYDEAVEYLTQHSPDVVLLDIMLDYSEHDGIDLAHYINETIKIPFIYITANADIQTVNRAKGTQPAAFILKPFNEQAIYANLEIALFNTNHQAPFKIKHAGKNIIVERSNIVFIKADNMYTEIHTSDNKKYLVRKFMKQVSEELNSKDFIQVHRSYIMNRNYIRTYNREFIFIGDEKIPIGDSYRDFLS